MSPEFALGLHTAAAWVDEMHYALNGNRLGDVLLRKFNLGKRVRRAQRPAFLFNCPCCDHKLPVLSWGMSWNRWQWSSKTGSGHLYSAYRELAKVWHSDDGKWVASVGSVAKTHKTAAEARRWCLKELKHQGERRP